MTLIKIQQAGKKKPARWHYAKSCMNSPYLQSFVRLKGLRNNDLVTGEANINTPRGLSRGVFISEKQKAVKKLYKRR